MLFDQTFSGVSSRTDINLISSTVSLFEESTRSIVDRPLVIYSFASSDMYQTNMSPKYFVACGMVEQSSTKDDTATSMSRRIEQILTDGKTIWKNVIHPIFAGDKSKADSNLELDGIERPSLSVDSLSLKTAAPTHKSQFFSHPNYQKLI